MTHHSNPIYPMKTTDHHPNTMQHAMHEGAYSRMGLMLAVSFCIMYGVMFLNVDDEGHIYLSLTRAYMSLLMVTPMALLMLGLMRKMYPNRRLNITIALGSILIFIIALLCLRRQMFVSDQQYMRAMIPHHSSAIMTSRHAHIQDAEVKKLSQSIIESQQKEIEQMKAILHRMDR
jgi:FtsH-binding integral membrane protein